MIQLQERVAELEKQSEIGQNGDGLEKNEGAAQGIGMECQVEQEDDSEEGMDLIDWDAGDQAADKIQTSLPDVRGKEEEAEAGLVVTGEMVVVCMNWIAMTEPEREGEEGIVIGYRGAEKMVNGGCIHGDGGGGDDAGCI